MIEKKERQKERSRKCCYDTVYDTIPELFQSLESTQMVLADEDLKGKPANRLAGLRVSVT